MELRHLRYFVAVAEDLNYRKASERLHVATPALSSQIKDLEYEMGVQLLDRDTGGVRLTDAGTAFLAEARLILLHSQHAMVAAQDAEKGRSGQLAVGYTAPTLMGFMPACLMAFYRRFPDVNVNLVEMSIWDQIAALESETIQIGFSIEASTRFPRGLRAVKIAHSPIRVVVAKTHRLAGSSWVALADLAHEQLLSVFFKAESATLHREIMRRIFAAHGLQIGPIKQIDGPEAFRAVLESGLGASLLPELSGLAQSPALVFKRLKDTGADLAVDLHALWRDDRPSTITTNFVAVMREVAPRGKPRAQQF
jgi:LysR family transcriptional regulator, benzoate and cis,cis-muconate-responsive activator of ben and cat genes